MTSEAGDIDVPIDVPPRSSFSFQAALQGPATPALRVAFDCRAASLPIVIWLISDNGNVSPIALQVAACAVAAVSESRPTSTRSTSSLMRFKSTPKSFPII